MDRNLDQIKVEVYDKIKLAISDFIVEPESQEYCACKFELNGWNIVCRSAKITPKKLGQFVTFWKRNSNGTIEPLHQNDQFDFYVVNVRSDDNVGQFVFPKTILIKKGIISTDKKEGKRAFRVYPAWEKTNNKQAERNQKWQLDYFYEINESTDLKKVSQLYETK